MPKLSMPIGCKAFRKIIVSERNEGYRWKVFSKRMNKVLSYTGVAKFSGICTGGVIRRLPKSRIIGFISGCALRIHRINSSKTQAYQEILGIAAWLIKPLRIETPLSSKYVLAICAICSRRMLSKFANLPASGILTRGPTFSSSETLGNCSSNKFVSSSVFTWLKNALLARLSPSKGCSSLKKLWLKVSAGARSIRFH